MILTVVGEDELVGNGLCRLATLPSWEVTCTRCRHVAAILLPDLAGSLGVLLVVLFYTQPSHRPFFTSVWLWPFRGFVWGMVLGGAHFVPGTVLGFRVR